MGSQFSSDIKYVYTNINGARVSIPYVRLANGQWIPFQQQLQSYQSPYYNSQRLLQSPVMTNGNMYPYNDYYVPNQVYYNGFLR